MKFTPAIHHRRSMRLKGYDYTQPGAYFVTLVTYHRDEIFGEVANGVMKLSSLGQIVYDEWMRSAEIRKEIRLYEDEFVVMPNHVHGIVWIVSTETGAHRAPLPEISRSVGADGIRPDVGIHPDSGIGQSESGARRAPQQGSQEDTDGRDSQEDTDGRDARLAPGKGAGPAPQRVPKSLGSFIAGFKASVTSRAGRKLDMTGIWQRNYYDHIIRSEKEFQAIWSYIDNNPQKWESDQLHPSALPNPFNQE